MNLLLAIGASLLGAVSGSFAVTAGLRWARGEQALAGRSHCDACAAPLGFGQTVPVVSYIRLGGACAGCRAAIDPGHLMGELAGAGLVLICVVVLPLGLAVLASALGLVLVGAAAADARSRRLPDLASLAVAVLGAALALQRGWPALLAGALAALVATALLLGLRRAFLQLKGDPGLGLGDVKLVAALAVWLGAASAWAVALAGLLGLAAAAAARWREREPADGRRAFGPYLATAGWIVGVALQAGLFGDLVP